MSGAVGPWSCASVARARSPRTARCVASRSSEWRSRRRNAGSTSCRRTLCRTNWVSCFQRRAARGARWLPRRTDGCETPAEARREVRVDRFREWLRAAGIERRVRWHDLRHTCASSLVAGWWGRQWSLEEVREMLGHSSVLVTERTRTLRRARSIRPRVRHAAAKVPRRHRGPILAGLLRRASPRSVVMSWT